MVQSNLEFQQLIDTDNSQDIQLIRFCLSDKVILPIDSQAAHTLSSVQYVNKILRHHVDEISELFDLKATSIVPYHDELYKAWIFDYVLLSVLVYRIAQVRTRSFESVSALMSLIAPYQLAVISPNLSTLYTGLSIHQDVVNAYIQKNSQIFYTVHVSLLQRLTNAVSNFHQPSWILHDPLWIKALYNYPKRLHTLRGFLYICLASYSIPDGNLESLFEISRDDIFRHMEAFIDLREDPCTDLDDITSFLYHIAPEFSHVPENPFFESLYNQSFESFETFHQKAFGNQYRRVVVPDIGYEQPHWESLRALGPQYAPEMVIHSQISPVDLAVEIVRSQREEIFRLLVPEITQSKGLPPSLRPNPWIEAAVIDRVLQLLLLRRYLHLYKGNVNKAKRRVTQTQHLSFLLILQDENGETLCDRTGLVNAPDVLTYQLSQTKGLLTPSEHHIILDLITALQNLHLTDRAKTPKAWLPLFQEESIRLNLRAFLFSLIEILHVSPEHNLRDLLGVTREDVYTYVQSVTECLNDPPSKEEIISLLDYRPQTSNMMLTTITPWDRHVWLSSFNGIPSSIESSSLTDDCEQDVTYEI